MNCTSDIQFFYQHVKSWKSASFRISIPAYNDFKCKLPDSVKGTANIFKTQLHFLQALVPRKELYVLSNIAMYSRNIRFSNYDSKSIIFAPIGDLKYDINPHWLHLLPSWVSDKTFSLPNYGVETASIFSRSNLSYSHYVATDLALILLLDKTINNNIPIHSAN